MREVYAGLDVSDKQTQMRISGASFAFPRRRVTPNAPRARRRPSSHGGHFARIEGAVNDLDQQSWRASRVVDSPRDPGDPSTMRSRADHGRSGANRLPCADVAG